MPRIICSDLSLSWPDGTPALSHITASFGPGRTGLIGRNGTGKSTFLRLLAGELAPASGSVATDGSLAYLPQTLPLSKSTTIADLLGISPVLAALDAIQRGSTDADHFALVGDDWDIGERALALLERQRLPAGLFSGGKTLARTMDQLSGGEAMRVALSGIALRKPDITLLDEPTNNLDMESVRELTAALNGYRGAMIVVSHDRRFLSDLDVTREWVMEDMDIAEDAVLPAT